MRFYRLLVQNALLQNTSQCDKDALVKFLLCNISYEITVQPVATRITSEMETALD